MFTLSAGSRLREEILKSPNVFLLTRAGSVDRVIRVVPLEGKVLNLDNGPEGEEWATVERQIFLRSRSDRALPQPVPVAQSSRDEWSISLVEIPTIVLLEEGPQDGRPAASKPEQAAPVVAAPTPEPVAEPVVEAKQEPVTSEHKCASCGFIAKTDTGLRVHQAKHNR